MFFVFPTVTIIPATIDAKAVEDKFDIVLAFIVIVAPPAREFIPVT